MGRDTYRITLTSGNEVLLQAKGTAYDFMSSAVKDIDTIFGEGYAKKNPALIAAYVQAAAIDCASVAIAQQIRAGLDYIADVIDVK